MNPLKTIGLLLLLLVGAGCGNDETPVKVDLTNREPVKVAAEFKGITYAYLPQYAHTVAHQRHRLLIDYLRNATGLRLKQVFPDTFDHHIQMVGRGEIDISYVNPFIYVTLAQRYGARAFVRVVEGAGRKDFRGQIICRADNEAIQTIEDCRGKRWIAVAPTSAGGYLYPLGLFRSHGLAPKDFGEVVFAPGSGGKQENVVLAVHAGKFDIGTIREGTLDVVADRVDPQEVRVVANTRWYPGWVYAYRAGMDPGEVARIKAALLKLDYHQPAHRPILEAANITGLVASDDGDFDPVRELAAQVGIKLGN